MEILKNALKIRYIDDKKIIISPFKYIAAIVSLSEDVKFYYRDLTFLIFKIFFALRTAMGYEKRSSSGGG